MPYASGPIDFRQGGQRQHQRDGQLLPHEGYRGGAGGFGNVLGRLNPKENELQKLRSTPPAHNTMHPQRRSTIVNPPPRVWRVQLDEKPLERQDNQPAEKENVTDGGASKYSTGGKGNPQRRLDIGEDPI